MNLSAVVGTDPLPSPDTPVFGPHVLAEGYAGPVIRYGDDIWPLSPMNSNPSADAHAIHWSGFPADLREEFRLITWTMINGSLSASFVRERAATWRNRTSAPTIYQTVWLWRRMATWMHEQGLDTLSSCGSTTLEKYASWLLETGATRSRIHKVLITLTRLWAFDALGPHPLGVGRPPWDVHGVDDYLPPATTAQTGENLTEELSPETMGPLLIWAIRLVDDFAEDILAADAERRRLRSAALASVGTPDTLTALHSYIDRRLAADRPLPTHIHAGRRCLNSHYVAGTTGASLDQVHRRLGTPSWKQAVARRPGPCPLSIRITGAIDGRPWRDAIDFNETLDLLRHLTAACFIVIAYLTGMRPGEVLGLRSGCCPDPAPDENGRLPQHKVYGHVYKTARDDGGNHVSAGVVREAPWVAIAPVVHAVRVLERLVPSGALLFDHRAHYLGKGTVQSGDGSLRISTIRGRIEEFIVWANAEAGTLGRAHEVIPPDPHGSIGTERFRRTLAWHIARRPGGLVALAIQYGHLRTTVSAGYASRSRDGIHKLLNVETARATIDTITDLQDDLDNGIGVSGPAARRAINAAATAPQFQGTIVTARTARKILSNPALAVYDNPNTLLMCVYNRDRALCHRDTDNDSPSLDRCVSACANIARSDHHADQLRERATALDTRASRLPGPIGDRLRGNAAKCREIADDHDRTRIVLPETAP
ncbi:integrase [Streptomyces sp. NPDC002589]|uniref:integrase n=1 Tax=Streptomyces sp. NPDC002589 TaxID=3154420 RepID=UPI0033270FF9